MEKLEDKVEKSHFLRSAFNSFSYIFFLSVGKFYSKKINDKKKMKSFSSEFSFSFRCGVAKLIRVKDGNGVRCFCFLSSTIVSLSFPFPISNILCKEREILMRFSLILLKFSIVRRVVKFSRL